MGAADSIPEGTVLIYTLRRRDATSVSGNICIHREGNVLNAVATLTVDEYVQVNRIILNDQTTVLAWNICSGKVAFRLEVTITKHDNEAVEVMCHYTTTR